MSSTSGRRYEYLFLDMEWNQKAGTSDVEHREPIQIGMIGTDAGLEIKKTFSKGIRLENVETLTEETSKTAHVTKKNVMLGRTEREVFTKAASVFSYYRYVVVWTMGTYELFKAGMKRSGIKMPRHKAVLLQDILDVIAMDKGRHVRFESALEEAEIPYVSNYLHYSKHDVKYLYELFKTMYIKYSAITAGEMCVVNTRSKIIHDPDCRYAKNRRMGEIAGGKKLLFLGYRSCRCCGEEKKWRRFQWKAPYQKAEKEKRRQPADLRKLPLTDDNIRLICQKFGLKCKIVSNVVLLETAVGEWRIHISENKVHKVFHGNYRIKRSEANKKNKKYNENFHKQDISKENFYDVISYIYCHDKGMLKKKKNRMDMLFEKIEQERLMKGIIL